MKITGLKCTVLGRNPVVRITTDEGIDGYGQAETAKAEYLKPHVDFYRRFILGEDPTDVMRVVARIRRLGGFKPWGSAVSCIEMALWDIAGKAAGLPVYKLLGGKLRDRVRVYNGSIRFSMEGDVSPEAHARVMRRMVELPHNFSLIKQGIGFHSRMPGNLPDFFYGDPVSGPPHANRGPVTERGLNHMVDCIRAMKEVCGDRVGLALDCGPGFMPADALRLARAVEDLHIAWLEDTITGDYVPWVHPDVYRDVTRATSVPIHTGEQIYLRENFKPLIEAHAVDIVGPDPNDIGGLAELKWVAECADLHGIMMAPHGTGDGLLGLAALVQVSATLGSNYIAFELPSGDPPWWNDIVAGLPEPLVVDSHIKVWDSPGLGVRLIPEAARPYLPAEDADFFD